MKKFTLLQAKLSTLSLLFVLLCQNITLAQGFSPKTQADLQQVLQSFQNDPSFVGGISAAIKVDGLASWQGASGYAARNVDASNNLLPGGTQFQTATLSRIYSVTKTFTAALTLELSKAGILNLDQPLSAYLPLNLVNPGLNASVTLRQLLAHESGYSNYTDEMQFLIAVAFQPTHIWTPFEVASFVHQIDQPGAERQYSSTNYILLGAVIEAVTGQPVETHYRTRFLTPLGLQSMYLGVRESQPAGTSLAAPHDDISPFNPIFQFTGQPVFPNSITNISAFPFQGIVSAAFTGGGLVSNASDMASWGNALFTGKATSQSTIDEMIASISTIPDEQGDYLGYGIWKSTRMSSTETFIGHDGNAPGYRSVIYFQPDKKLTLVVLTNFHGADIYAIAKALYAVLPEFNCGNTNTKEDKIRLCNKGNSICVNRNAADVFIQNGAYLGECNVTDLASPSKKIPDAIMESDNSFRAYPNPSTDKILFNFTAETKGPVSLDLYDMNGRLVAQLFNGELQKGMTKQITFERKNLPSGIYISSLKNLFRTRQKKIVLVN
jgi:CubicO group peptidase (beta-lactamase class C family)